MKLHYLLALILVFSISTNIVFAMDVGALYRQTTTALEQEQVPAGQVILVSQEDNEFELAQTIAQQSQTINEMIKDIGAGRKIFLNAIPNQTLAEIVNLLKSLQNHQNLQDKALLDALEKDVTSKDPFLLLAAANYLDIQPIIEVAARAIARQEMNSRKGRIYFINEGPLSKETHEKLFKLFGNDKQRFISLIARYFVLISGGKKLTDIPQDIYGLSIQDYLDYKFGQIKPGGVTSEQLKFPIIFFNRQHIIADKFENLNNLYGLPNIQNINEINFENFRFLNTKENFFNELDLQRFGIYRSSIDHIPINALKNLKNLEYLTLSENKIKTIPTNISELRNLIYLDLNENNIKQIPEEISILNKLQHLDLRQNNITNIDHKVIGALSKMPALQHLDLAHNPLNNETKQALRHALNNKVIFYED